MQLVVLETAPHVWSVLDVSQRASTPLAQFTDEIDAELWAAARVAAEIMGDGREKSRLLTALDDAARRSRKAERRAMSAEVSVIAVQELLSLVRAWQDRHDVRPSEVASSLSRIIEIVKPTRPVTGNASEESRPPASSVASSAYPSPYKI